MILILETMMYRHMSRRFLHMSGRSLKDYYKILGISRNSKDNEIKKAYYQVLLFYNIN